MGVVDHVEEWLYFSGPGKQGKRCKADLKTLGWLAADQSEGRASAFCWAGAADPAVSKRDDHLMEPGESQFHFNSIPTARTTRKSLAAATACSKSAVFPCPAHHEG